MTGADSMQCFFSKLQVTARVRGWRHRMTGTLLLALEGCCRNSGKPGKLRCSRNERQTSSFLHSIFQIHYLCSAKLPAALGAHCTQQDVKPNARLLIPRSRAITCSTLTAPGDCGHTLGYLRALRTPAPAEHAWQCSHTWLKVSSAKKATTEQERIHRVC